MPESMNWALAWPYFTAALVVGYLLGSIPFGVVLTRISGGPDLRTIGSGNIGATNVLRTGSKKLAAATLLGDMLKGTLAVVICSFWGPNTALLAALGAFLGHLFPIWIGFRGGKGVATYLGCLLGIDWRIGLAFIAVWVGVAVLSRYSSLSALIAGFVAPVGLFLRGDLQAAELFLLLFVLLLWKHRENIQRLLTGTESKIGKSA